MKSSKISGEAEVLKMIRKMNQKMIRNREVEVFFIVEIIFLYFCSIVTPSPDLKTKNEQMKKGIITTTALLLLSASLLPCQVIAQENGAGKRTFGSQKEEKQRLEGHSIQNRQEAKPGQPKPTLASSMRGDMLVVRTPRPGSLKELLTPDVKKRVRRLAIEGAINKDDASVLRSIANRTSCVDDRGKSVDNYLDLDLSRATIESSYISSRDVTYDDMFYYARHLRSIHLPMRLKGIGRSTFYSCSELESIVIPQGVRFLGERAFKDCTDLGDVRLPETLEEIGEECFDNCKSLTRIQLPSSLQKIGNEAFYGCPLTALHLPDGLQSLGKQSLSGTALRSIFIPRGTHIEGDYPGNNSHLEEIVVDEGNREYCSLDGVLFNRSRTQLLLMPSAQQGEYAIPEGITTIRANAFRNSQMSRFHFPSTIVTIGEGAFSACRNLRSIEIPGSVSVIPPQMFSDCTNLQRVMIPDQVEGIGEKAFNNCTQLAQITLPSQLVSLGEEVFRDCTSLSNLSLPSALRSIGNEAFRSCTSLTEITLPASVETIGKKPFYKCTQLQRVICESTTPPVLKSKGNEKSTLVVPSGSANLYKKAASWKKYKSIVEK